MFALHAPIQHDAMPRRAHPRAPRPGGHEPSLCLAASFTACVASWILELDVIAATMKAMGLEMPLAAGLLVLLAVNVALAFPFAPPANLGTLEFGASVALMGFGVPKEKAVAFGIVYHLLQIVPIMILGALIAGRGSWRPPADEPSPGGPRRLAPRQLQFPP